MKHSVGCRILNWMAMHQAKIDNLFEHYGISKTNCGCDCHKVVVKHERIESVEDD